MQNPQFATPKTSYRKLNVYKKAEAIYDLTYIFLQSHISKKDEHMIRCYRLPAPASRTSLREGLTLLFLLRWKLSFSEWREEASMNC